MILTENPGRPYGSRPEDDEAVFAKPRHRAALPWHDQATDEPPKLRAAEKPRRTIPGGPGPGADLPCAGKWALFDQDEVTEEARLLCASCPFQAWCLKYATENNEQHIWAGTDYSYRRALRKDVAA